MDEKTLFDILREMRRRPRGRPRNNRTREAAILAVFVQVGKHRPGLSVKDRCEIAHKRLKKLPEELGRVPEPETIRRKVNELKRRLRELGEEEMLRELGE
jgi:hypothetical protein